MAPISTRGAFHSSITHSPHHTWLWIVIVFFFFFFLLSEIRCENCPPLTIFQKKKKKRRRKRLRRNAKHGNTSEWRQHRSHDHKPPTGQEQGNGFPNTQRGELQRGEGSHCDLNQCLGTWHGQPSDPSSGVQSKRRQHGCHDWRRPSPSTGMNKTCAGRNYGLSC